MNGFCFKVPSVAALMIMIPALAGCNITPPKNAAEFRAMAKEGKYFMSNETYVVKRPYQQVVNTYKQRAPTCLNQTIETTTRDRYGVHVSSSTWTAKVNSTDKRMECTMQLRSNDSNVIEVYDPPNKYGHYHLLVDAYPVDQNTTRIVLSKTLVVSDVVVQATKNWATGENMGCPDMTQ